MGRYKINTEKELFELIESMGEQQTDLFHIIDISDSFVFEYEGEKIFRVYHKNGYCFEVGKLVLEDDESGNVIDYTYSFSQTWDGFKNDLNIVTAANLLLNK